MDRCLKVLISAYACEPNKGSEPGVGWEYAKHLAQMNEVWVVTRANNRKVIESELTKHPAENLHVVYIDLPRWTCFWKAGARGMHFYYCLWQVMLLKKVREMHIEHKFDILHHLTFGNIWLPTFIPIIGIPFVWGPIGGGEKIPQIFINRFSFTAKCKEHLRGLILRTLRFNPFFRYCCIKARVIVVKTEHTARLIPEIHNGKVIQMTDVGISIDSNTNSKQSDYSATIRIICVGHLTYWRGYDIAIRAFAKIHKELENAILTIVGDGPEQNSLIKIAEKEGVMGKVVFTNRISKIQLEHEMNASTIFLNPCLKEGGVTVLIDAMQRGMPVVCMDTGGVNDIVPDVIKIPLRNPEQTITDLSKALLMLGKNRMLREELGVACKISIQKNTWESKAKLLHEIFAREAEYGR